MIGAWINYDQLEESLTLDELYVIANSIQIKEHNHMRTMAAIQGVEIPDIEGATDQEEPKEDFRTRIEQRAREQQEAESRSPKGMIGTGYKQI